MKIPILLATLGMTLFLGGTAISEEDKDSVKLTIIYESYCPFCIDFIVHPLYKTWEKFKHHIKLDLVPYGNAKLKYEGQRIVFICNHGEQECVANILHSCAIYQACGGNGTLNCPVDQLAKVLAYITCVMQQPNQKTASDRCASQAGLQSTAINQCANGDQGYKLELVYAHQTIFFRSKYDVRYTPTTLVTHKNHTEKVIGDVTFKDLTSVICKYIPDQCA